MDGNKVWFLNTDPKSYQEYIFQSRNSLIEKINAFQSKSEGAIDVGYIGGVRPFWQQLLGKGSNFSYIIAALVWQNNWANLLFYDEKWTEYRVIDNNVDKTKAILIQENKPSISIEESISKTLAFSALKELINTGKRPDFLEYKVVN